MLPYDYNNTTLGYIRSPAAAELCINTIKKQ